MSIGEGPILDPTARTGEGGRTSGARTVARHFMAWTFGLGRNVWLLPLDVAFRSVGIRYGWLKWLFETVPPPVLAITGRLRAERATWRAIRRVPAYRDYLERNRIDPDGLLPAAILRAVPETDKASYIDPYPIDQRCVEGRIAFKGVTIDESSGSTGTPYNWIRGAAERSVAQRNIAFFARYAFGAGDLVTLNAFSMGAWATGFNMSLGMNRHGLVKSIGPDIPKILSSLAALGPSHRYLISGYPPFIKHLLDEGDRQGFPVGVIPDRVLRAMARNRVAISAASNPKAARSPCWARITEFGFHAPHHTWRRKLQRSQGMGTDLVRNLQDSREARSLKPKHPCIDAGRASDRSVRPAPPRTRHRPRCSSVGC